MALSKKQAQGPLPSTNQEWGYFGTLVRAGFEPSEAEMAFARMSANLIQAGATPEEAQQILDGTQGRHMADQMLRPLSEAKQQIIHSYDLPQGAQSLIRRFRSGR